VATMTTLTSLDMSSCYDVDDEAVLIVSKLPQLKSLSLSYTDISDGAVAIICGGQVKRKDDKNKTVLIDYPVSNCEFNKQKSFSIAGKEKKFSGKVFDRRVQSRNKYLKNTFIMTIQLVFY
jgi:hypothetical protein